MLVALIAAAAGAPNSYAIDPNRAMSQYLHDRWGPEQGLSIGTVFAMSQTADGYLWIGGQAGLVRFDGWKFRVTPDMGGQIENAGVFGLAADNDGNLWIEQRGPKMFRYRDGAVLDIMAGVPYAVVTSLTRTRDGNLLASLADRGIVTYKQRTLQVLVDVAALPRSPVTALAQTSEGAVWFGTRDAGLFRISGGGRFSSVAGMRNAKVNSLLAGSNGELWIGTDQGLSCWNGSSVKQIALGGGLAPEVLALAQDRDKNLWVGTGSRGLLRLNEHGLSTFHVRASSSSDDAVTAVFEDREGSLWIGSASGLERLRDSIFVSYSGPEGFPTEAGTSIFVDSDNRLWFAPAEGGLWWLKGEQYGRVSEELIGNDVIYSITGSKDQLWLGKRQGGLTQLHIDKSRLTAKTYKRRDGLAENNIFSVYTSRDGAVWAGTLSSGVSRLQNGHFTTYTAENGLASDTVSAMLEDSGGTMWFATPDGLSSFSDRRWRTYSTEDGLPAPAVNCLLQDSRGVLWAGTAAGLAYRTSSGFRATGQISEGLREPVFGIAEDRAGWLWVTTSSHVFRVNRNQIVEGKLRDRDIRQFGIGDGLRGVEGVARYRSVVADSSGRIWLSLNRGVSVVDPGRLAYRAAPPIIHTESISADGKAIPLSGSIQIPPGTTRIALAYTAAILSSPERVRFRYRLDGLDHNWNESVSALQASYTNLTPGSYRFRVQATGADGVWGAQEGGVGFEIRPTVVQALWFRSAAVAVLCLGVLALYRRRLHQLTRELDLRFEERLAERTRIAQELHDTLLQGFISANMQLHLLADGMPEDSSPRRSLDRILKLIGEVIEEGRNALRGLRLPETGPKDLGQAFARVPQEIGVEEEVKFRIRIEGQSRAPGSLLRDDIYRIGREALVNAFRHAHAKNVEVEIEYGPKRFRLVVRDDGCGIDESILKAGRDGHWGLRGMRERSERIGGNLHVWSRAMKGTEVEFSVPNHIAFDCADRELRVGRLIRIFTRKTLVENDTSR